MRDGKPIEIPPTGLDRATARAVARHVDPPLERALQTATWAADEKVLLVATVLAWGYLRLTRQDEHTRCEADRMLCSVSIAGLLPHLFKHVVARTRPDRTTVHLFRHGIPKSGSSSTSFPSGHAVHLGALAVPAWHLAPPALRPLIAPLLLGLGATRVALLAHFPTDILAGFGIGALLDQAVGRWLCGRGR
jgi:membrane-associated phospholipid phosphatase